MKHTLLFTLLLSSALSLSAKDYYVSPDGSDKNNGTINAPFATVGKAVSKLSAGDVCYIRGGSYHEEVILDGLAGTQDQPIEIKAYNGEKVTFNGTKAINVTWNKYKDNIYQAQLDFPIWQLFVDDISMTSARYPNGNWYDGSVWDTQKSMIWPNSTCVKNHFNGEYLKSFDFSMEDGGIIIINSSSWGTSTSMITEHKAGSDNFKYDPSTVLYRSNKPKVTDMRYSFEGKLEFLDTEGEWFYEPKTKKIYLWAPDNANPNDMNIAGKVQTYAFSGRECAYVALQGINFFGTTVGIAKSNDVRIEDCDFMFPAYSKRMLGDISDFGTTHLTPKNNNAVANFAIINCRFEYTEGAAITSSGHNVLIENCYAAYIDYSCTLGDAAGMYLNNVTNLTFRHNTIKYSGASSTLQLGGKAIVEYNDISQTGFMQHDGALIQLRVGAAPNSIVRYNWLHHSIKTGIRTDNVNQPGAAFGVNSTVHHNVCWGTDRAVFLKGDEHHVFNNLCFGSKQRDLIISSNEKINGFNHSTITRNNAAATLSGHQSALASRYPLPGIADHNWAGEERKIDLRTKFRDIENLDFRPKADTDLIDGGVLIDGKNFDYIGDKPDIGAYEYGDKNYWIAGYRDKKATVPIPCHRTKTAKVNADLMWLGAYKANEYKIYFGESPENLKLISTQSNNICTPPALKAGKTYYWRVDCSGERGESTGDVWNFTVESGNDGCALLVSSL